MKLKSIGIMFLLLLAIWLILNNSLELQVILPGIGLSLIIALVFCSRCSVFDQIKLSPKALAYTIAFIFVFLGALIKSNVSIAAKVLSPSLPINPGIVKAKTRLISPMGRMILANSITLTPGTLTVDTHENNLYIHCVNVEEDMEVYAKNIVRKFEKYLEVIYG